MFITVTDVSLISCSIPLPYNYYAG